MSFGLKHVRVFISDVVTETEEFQVDERGIEKEIIAREKKGSGLILNCCFLVFFLPLSISTIVVSLTCRDPTCVGDGMDPQSSLQNFLLEDGVVISFACLMTLVSIILTITKFPMYGVTFARINCGFAVVGLFVLQIAEFSSYKSFFPTSVSDCQFAVITMTIVMNLLFFGGPVLIIVIITIITSERRPRRRQGNVNAGENNRNNNENNNINNNNNNQINPVNINPNNINVDVQ